MPRVATCTHRPLAGSGLRARLAVFVFAFALVARLAAVEVIRSYPSLTLKDGRQLLAVEVINFSAGSVLVRHAGGATTVRATLLPANIVSDLHLEAWIIADNLGFDPSLADRPAVEAPALANQAAAAETSASLADRAASDAPAAETNVPAAIADAPAIEAAETVATAPAVPAAAPAAPVSLGEGNMPEFFSHRTEIASAAPAPATVSGRIVVALPSGEKRFLGNVQINAYPVEVLSRYLADTKSRCYELAQKLVEQAIALEKAGRLAEARMLTERARNTTAHYLDYLPPAPFSTRSDDYGFFTLPRDGRSLCLVASGAANGPQGTWNYEWVGLAAAPEVSLTEANATSIGAPLTKQSQYAAK
ncbi:MAG TPA: hypothetical protein VHD62_17745 [Opitutaceae bacterium]|nr:hypothetical protein [Opitutaceae bacterium]